MDALFTVLDDDRVLPTELSRGPWSLDALHGGPVAAIVIRAAERALAATGAPATVPNRLTLDLERPVPLAPLVVRAEVVRPGRKIQVAEVTVHDEGGRRLARASVLAIRRADLDLPQQRFAPADPVPPGRESADDVPMWVPMADTIAFHKDAVEHRFVAGGFLRLGPATDWIRLRVPVVADEEPSPLQRLVAAADFVNGLSGVLPVDAWTFINPDLTTTVHRLPVGEWIGIDAVTRLDPSGVGTAEGELFDETGRVGRCVQTLLVEAR
jgi:hypothetical protein